MLWWLLAAILGGILETTMTERIPAIPLPKGWPRYVRSAVVHVISLAQYATAYSRSWAADSANGRVRLRAERDRLEQELLLEREASRIKDARMGRVPPQRRPHYSPVERLEILQLRAARGWSLQQTADAFLVTPETVASWMKRLDEAGPQALVQRSATRQSIPGPGTV